MSFASPLALLGLLMLGVPVLIHLLRQKDVPKRVLPTVALLTRARAESRRRVRIRDRALLVMRAMAFAAVVCALAAPLLLRNVAFDDARVTSMVIVLDDSMSMQDSFEDARERALDAVDALPADSEVAVVLASAAARVLVPRTDDMGLARRALEGLEVSERGTDLAGASRSAERLLSGAQHSRRMLVLSDFRASTFADDVDWPRDVESVFERFAGQQTNVAIVSAEASPDPTTPGEVSVQIRVHGPAGTYPIELRDIDHDDVIATSSVQVNSAGRGDVTVHASDETSAATVVLDVDDAADADNRRGVLMRPTNALRVVIVNGDPRPGRGDEVSFLVRALDAVSGSAVLGARLQTRVIDTDTLNPSTVRGADLIIVANVRAPTSRARVALRAHIEARGALWLIGGDQVDATRWRSALGGLLPATLGPPTRGSRTLEVLDEELATLGIDRTTARSALALEASPNAEVLARWSDGTPALVALDTVLVLGASIDDDWSDLPYQPGFVALMGRLISRTARSPMIPSGVVAPGHPVAIGDEELRVATPHGDFESTTDAEFTLTEKSGVYRVLDGHDQLVGAFVVAPPESESDVSPGPVPAAEEAGRVGGSAISRRPLDTWVFALFGVLVIGEGAWRQRRRKS